MHKDISIVVPLFNEEESLPELTEWIEKVCVEHGYAYEVIMIDDGSTDDSWHVIEKLSETNPHIRGIRFQRNYGKSAALNEGFKAAVGNVVITMDADLQDSPDEIPELYRMVTAEGFDLVSGWKKKRYDNAVTKNIPSKLYNSVNRRISGIKLHDMNCGLKAYKKKVVKSIEVYGEMHRYIAPGGGELQAIREQVQQEADALLRLAGYYHIHVRLRDHCVPDRCKTVLRPAIRAHEQAGVLPRHCMYDHRYTVLPHRLYCRTGLALCCRQEPLFDRAEAGVSE